MEFLDEDARPRFLFQSRPLSSSSSSPSQNKSQNTHQSPLSNPLLFISISAFSSLLCLISLLYLQSEPFKSLLIWVALSVFLGQFAPSQITGGDIRVGHGNILEPLEEEPERVPEKPASKRRSKAVRSEETVRNLVPIAEMRNGSESFGKKIGSLVRNEEGEEERVWSEEDVEVLKRQMVKNPVGKPRRWEVIAEAFKGRHKVESVIKKGKDLGEKKVDDTDSYAKFLKNRKPLDTRIQGENVGVDSGGESGKDINGGGVGGWSAGEDIALLNALKAFPKDAPMRWEKIAAAVPGKSKAACVKRIAELQRDFRSSKATAAAPVTSLKLLLSFFLSFFSSL